MGNAKSANLQPVLTSEETTNLLRVLGSATIPIENRTRAFQQLRSHFVRQLTTQERLATVEAVDAQRYDMWPPPPSDASLLSTEDLADKVRGLVFGSALGDATGLATEFLSCEHVREFYGEGFPFAPQPASVYPDTHRLMWTPGDWTDDTDQLVLLLQSFLHCGGRADECDFAQRLVRWRERGFPELGDESAAGLGQHTKNVVSKPAFVETPIKVAHACWERGGCTNAANGALMRTAITGVPHFWERPVVIDNTVRLCCTTHADPRCIVSCVVLAVCVSEMLRGASATTSAQLHALIGEAVASAVASVAPQSDSTPEMAKRTEGAISELRSAAGTTPVELHELQLDEPRSVGYTFKCLGAGLWALRSTAGFESTIRQIVAEGGDADTNAAVAGALLGCRLGFSRLPADWIAQLPHGAWLEAHVQKLLYMLRLR